MQIKRSYFSSIHDWCPTCSELTIPVINEAGQHVPMGIGDEILSGHLLVVGGPGTGKTNFILQLARECRRKYPDARFVFLDVKGDFLPLYQDSDMLCSFYPRQGEYTYFKWNVISQCLMSEHPEDELKEIVAKWFKEKIEQSGGNRFFPEAAKQIAEAYFLTVLRRARPGFVPTHQEIFHQLRRMNIDQMRARLGLEDDLAGALFNIAGTGGSALSNQAAGVMAEFNQFISSFFVGMLAGDGYDTIDGFLNGLGGRALFLEYDMKREETANILFRTLLDILIKNKLSTESERGKVFLFLDEFPTLKGDYSILNCLHVGREHGMSVIGGVQSKEQIYSICPGQSMEHTGNSIIGAFSSMVAFHPNDAQTTSYIQEKIGEDNITYMQFGLSRYEAPHMVMQREPLVSSRDINSLRLGEAYVKMREYNHQKVKFEVFNGGRKHDWKRTCNNYQ